MNLLLSNQLAENLQKGLAVPNFIGGVNASSISANSTSKAFSITNNVGDPLQVLGIIFRYNATFDDCLVTVVDTQRNKVLVSGNTQFCNLGVSKSVNSQFNMLMIAPFFLVSGNTVDVTVTNVTANPLPANGVSMSLYGLQMGK